MARFWAHAGVRPDDEEREAKLAAVKPRLTRWTDRHLGSRDFLVADRYTIADIAFYAYTHVAHEGGLSLDPYPSVRQWLTRVADQSAHIPITA